MEKKTYEAPVVNKVSLEIKNAVLALCYSSTISVPLGYCQVTQCALG